MGEIADSMIDSEFDYITGEYLGKGVGYPRSFHDKNSMQSDKNNPVNGGGEEKARR